MSGIRKILVSLATALLLSGGIVGVAAVPASAATCFGYSCHGRDPVAYNCSTVSLAGPAYMKSGSTVLATLWNRYSTPCRANWASAYLSPAAISAHYKEYVSVDTTDSQGHFEFVCWPGPNSTGALIEDCSNFSTGGYGGSGEAWSDMVDGTNTTLAAVCVYNSAGNQIGCAYANQ